MPGIKKKWIKASHKDESEKSTQGAVDDAADDDRDLNDSEETKDAPAAPKPKPSKTSPSPKGGMLKGLDGEVLMEKRKRFVPTAELKLTEWLDTNLEQRADETLPLNQLYGYYTELCQGEGWDVLDVPEFNKVVKGKFGKAFGLTADSVLKGLIKERKLVKEKKKPFHGIRMKDVIHEAIQHYSNPEQGVRFFSLKQFIGTKYPALQIDIKPKVLKRALEFGVHYGQLDLVKGIGMAGFYRLPGESEPKSKDNSNAKKDGDEKNEESKEGSEGKDGDTSEKSQDASAEDKENKDGADSSDKKKRQQKPKKLKPVKYSNLSHSNPDKVEDAFPLAITYQSAPKVVGIPKIRKYIATKYQEELTDNRWRQVIDKGVQNGLWEHTSGSGISGSIHLLMDDFDPSSNQVEDQVCAAIIACHEPKSASAGQIKKYVSQYHPDFKIDERPDKFKKALLRAVNKKMITQVSGLGANGSFQLTVPFVPSPAILAGEEDSDEEEEEDSDVDAVYISKGTKSRGIPKLKSADVAKASSQRGKSSGKGAAGRGRAQKRKSYNESSDEESNVPSKKKKKGSAPDNKSKSKSKGRKRSPSPLTEESEEELLEYTPRKSKSRGGGQTARSAEGKKSQPKGRTGKANAKSEPSPKKGSKKAQKGASSPAGKAKSTKSKKVVVEISESDADDEDDDVEPEYTPRKSKSRGGGRGMESSKPAGGGGKRSKK